MPYDTLETIHDARLPLIFTCPADANIIRSYVAAGLVKAEFQESEALRPAGQRPVSQATVSAITPAGRKAVERLRASRSMRDFRRVS